jgi:hypothetical protein
MRIPEALNTEKDATVIVNSMTLSIGDRLTEEKRNDPLIRAHLLWIRFMLVSQRIRFFMFRNIESILKNAEAGKRGRKLIFLKASVPFILSQIQAKDNSGSKKIRLSRSVAAEIIKYVKSLSHSYQEAPEQTAINFVINTCNNMTVSPLSLQMLNPKSIIIVYSEIKKNLENEIRKQIDVVSIVFVNQDPYYFDENMKLLNKTGATILVDIPKDGNMFTALYRTIHPAAEDCKVMMLELVKVY